MHAHTRVCSHPCGVQAEGTAAKSLRSDPQPGVYGEDLLYVWGPQHPCPLQRLHWERSLPAKPSLLAHHYWEPDMAAREVLLQTATVLTGFLQPACSPGLELLEADTTERPAWMERGGMHKMSVI